RAQAAAARRAESGPGAEYRGGALPLAPAVAPGWADAVAGGAIRRAGPRCRGLCVRPADGPHRPGRPVAAAASRPAGTAHLPGHLNRRSWWTVTNRSIATTNASECTPVACA